jgi:CheY-like chemotaxis protein
MSQSSGAGAIDTRGRATPGRADALPRVMYVDDEPRALSTLTRVLKSRFAIVTSDNGAEALLELEREGDFAVVIADVSMPRMDGFEFLDRVKEASPTTTRLALTGLSSLDSGNISREAVFRVLRKPCRSEVLFEALADAVHYHELLSASPFQPVESPRQRPRPPGLEPSLGAAPTITFGQPHAARLAVLGSRIGLRLAGRTIELLPGITIVGRSRTCHIPIDDPKVSRCHACFAHDEGQLTVRNLSSTNRLLLNGAPLGPVAHALQIGDRIAVGNQELEVCAVGDYLPSLEPTERISMPVPVRAPAPAPNDLATLGTLADVAEKYVRLGHSQDAERILRPLLEGLLRFCHTGRVPLAHDVKLAVELALGIAESTRSGAWVSYVFELLATLEQVPDSEVLERLYRNFPALPGVSMASYRAYVEVLLRRLERCGPAQRFLIRRVQGLEAALLRSAHV